MQHLALRMSSAFQLISRKVLWKVTVLCQLEDNQFKVRLKRKFLALYATTNFGYYSLADGSTLIVTIKEEWCEPAALSRGSRAVWVVPS